jgi:hypothetical protein
MATLSESRKYIPRDILSAASQDTQFRMEDQHFHRNLFLNSEARETMGGLCKPASQR